MSAVPPARFGVPDRSTHDQRGASSLSGCHTLFIQTTSAETALGKVKLYVDSVNLNRASHTNQKDQVEAATELGKLLKPVLDHLMKQANSNESLMAALVRAYYLAYPDKSSSQPNGEVDRKPDLSTRLAEIGIRYEARRDILKAELDRTMLGLNRLWDLVLNFTQDVQHMSEPRSNAHWNRFFLGEILPG